MRFVVGNLLRAAFLRNFKKFFYGIGDDIRIENDPPLGVSRGAAGDLNQRTFGTQEALLVRIENRNEPNLRQVDAFAQKVDADQTVERAVAQFGKNPDTLNGVDFGVKIFHAHSEFGEIIGETLRALFRKRGDNRSSAQRSGLADFLHNVVNLRTERTDFNFRIKQSGRAHDLFNHRSAGFLKLVIRGRGGNINGVAGQLFKLLEFERTVVQRGRQTEAVFNERDFAVAVRAVHRLHLRNRHMRFINHRDEIFLEEIKQTVRTGTRSAAGEVPRIVFNARTVADFAHHFQIVVHALEQALRFHEFVLTFKLLHTLLHLRKDGRRRRVQLLLGHDE